MLTIVLSTRNEHKLREIQAILGDKFDYVSLKDFPDAPVIKEDAGTFAANAAKKAVGLANWLTQQRPQESSTTQRYVLADDSGLEVDALGGAPGVHSARFAALDSAAGGNASDAANNTKLLSLLQNLSMERRTARFRCVLAFTPVSAPQGQSFSAVCYADEAEMRTQLFEGTCEGRIGFGPRGEGGFGYDPLFIPSGHTQTFAELGEVAKNSLSHRAQALTAL